VEEKNKEDENEQDMVPNFAETYEALEKVKAFFYAHSVTDLDHEHILGLEKSYFQLRQILPRSKRQCTTFFFKKKWFYRFTVYPHSPIVFSSPLKSGRSREHCVCYDECCSGSHADFINIKSLKVLFFIFVLEFMLFL
jgi:hypothetical protein